MHEETHNFIQRVGSIYGLKVRIVFPDSQELEDLLWNEGTNSFYSSVENREECCIIRKVHPLNRSLAGYDAWISGIRADQTANRKNSSIIEKNFDSSGRTKINPLLSWTRSDVWEYIEKNKVIGLGLYVYYTNETNKNTPTGSHVYLGAVYSGPLKYTNTWSRISPCKK